MNICMGRAWVAWIGVFMMVGGMVLTGCAPSIKYSYDPKADFSMIKTYQWAPGSPASREEALLEKNIQYFADQALGKKGYSVAAENPDMVFSMKYEYELGSYQASYQLSMLSLFVHRAGSKELFWQGTATGTLIGNIKADAGSRKLGETIHKILLNFPPKR